MVRRAALQPIVGSKTSIDLFCSVHPAVDEQINRVNMRVLCINSKAFEFGPRDQIMLDENLFIIGRPSRLRPTMRPRLARRGNGMALEQLHFGHGRAPSPAGLSDDFDGRLWSIAATGA